MPPDTTHPELATALVLLRDKDSRPQPFPFQRLSAELRNRIYEEAFDTTVTLTTSTLTSYGSGHGIVLACKQTHAEAVGLYYSKHTFRFTCPVIKLGDTGSEVEALRARFESWLEIIGSKKRKLLERVEFDTASFYDFRAQDLSDRFDRLGALDHVAYSAEGVISHIADRFGLSRVAASIFSPLSWDFQRKCSVVLTSTPRETLKEQKDRMERQIKINAYEAVLKMIANVRKSLNGE